MILGIYFAFSVIATITCEPPLNNYLPPGAGSGSGGRLSPQYGPPESNQGVFDKFDSGRGQPRDSFAPSRRGSTGLPSAEYGSPGFQSSSRGQQPEGFPQSSQYRTSNQEASARIRGGVNSERQSSQRLESSYGTPSQGFLSSEQNGFNNQRSTSQREGSRRQLGGSPSATYGTPDFGNDKYNTNQNFRSSGVDDVNEPAKYEFSYEIDDAETGTMFGQSEQRDGDLTTGQYNVVLPDGRKQVVEYEADKDGYKPQIRYEGTRRVGAASGNRRDNDGQGYPGAQSNADAFGHAQSEITQQGMRYQQPGFGGYPNGRPSENGQESSKNQGFQSAGVGGGYPGGSGGSSFPGGSQDLGGGFSGDRDGHGYSTSPQGVSSEGYPSGGPSGPRGSGF